MLWLFSLFQKLQFLICQVSTRSSFPKPLSLAQEQEYVQRYTQQGDMEARNQLIEHNLRLVAHIVKKYAVSDDTDDLISIGTIGLIKAISTYNPEKASHLASYASRCIENEILMHLRAGKRRKSEVSLQEPVGMDREGNEISLFDILGAADTDAIESVDYRLNTGKLFHEHSFLEEREQLVLTMRYGLNRSRPMTQKEVADQLGISRSYVSRIEKKALERLQERFVLHTADGKK